MAPSASSPTAFEHDTNGHGNGHTSNHNHGLEGGDTPPGSFSGASSPDGGNNGNSSGAANANKSHLSEEQKKANHIASEKKRRTNIREQYDKLAEMTPGMEGQGRSEGKVLEEVVKHGRELQRERKILIEEIERKGGVVPQELRRY